MRPMNTKRLEPFASAEEYRLLRTLEAHNPVQAAPLYERLMEKYGDHMRDIEEHKKTASAVPPSGDLAREPKEVAVSPLQSGEAADAPRAGAPAKSDTLKVKFSVVANVNASTPIKLEERTWGEFCSMLAAPEERPSKSHCRLLKLVTFGDQRNEKGNLRHNANVQSVYGLVGDYDGELVSPGEAAERARACGVEVLIYTSPSHQPNTPRWRVIAPLSRPYDQGEYGRLMSLLNGALDGILAGESWTVSQMFYFGRVKGVPYESYRVEGTCIDELELIIQPIDKGSREPSARPKTEITGDITHRETDLSSVTEQTINEIRSASTYLAEKGMIDRYQPWTNLGMALASLKGSPQLLAALQSSLATAPSADVAPQASPSRRARNPPQPRR
jgi:hypothetical protein